MEFISNKIKLIIGLGNDDKAYANTYHNVGFLAADYLTKNPPTPNLQYLISKSTEYMNNSGKFVAKAIKKASAKPKELIVIHDDSDLTLGNYKLQFGSGAAGHHGVESVQAVLKTNDFWRLRIGIRPTNEPVRQKAKAFVLKKISSADQKILEGVFESIIKEFQ